MAIATSDLVDAFVSQLFYFERVRLEWIPISIFGHLADNAATVAELAHLTAAPRVKATLLISVSAVVLKEEFEIDLISARWQGDSCCVATPIIVLHVHHLSV